MLKTGESNCYDSIFHHYVDPILVLDTRTGCIRDANLAAIRFLERDMETLVGRPFSSLLSRERPPDAAAFSESLRAEGRAEDDWTLHLGSGKESRSHVMAQFMEMGGTPGYVVTLRPPSILREGGAAAIEAQARIDALYGEINDPLQEILSWIELQGNPRLQKPAQRLTETLRTLRGDGFLPPPSPLDAETYRYRTFDRRTPCSENKVLIVDDETNIRNLFNNILRLNVPDLSLEMAENGRRAIHAFEETHHCLIILDMKMPAMDGQKVLQQLREMCRLKHWQTPAVLLCSGYDSRHVAEAMTQSKMRCAFVQKPIGKRDLVHAVEEMLQRHMSS